MEAHLEEVMRLRRMLREAEALAVGRARRRRRFTALRGPEGAGAQSTDAQGGGARDRAAPHVAVVPQSANLPHGAPRFDMFDSESRAWTERRARLARLRQVARAVVVRHRVASRLRSLRARLDAVAAEADAMGGGTTSMPAQGHVWGGDTEVADSDGSPLNDPSASNRRAALEAMVARDAADAAARAELKESWLRPRAATPPPPMRGGSAVDGTSQRSPRSARFRPSSSRIGSARPSARGASNGGAPDPNPDGDQAVSMRIPIPGFPRAHPPLMALFPLPSLSAGAGGAGKQKKKMKKIHGGQASGDSGTDRTTQGTEEEREKAAAALWLSDPGLAHERAIESRQWATDGHLLQGLVGPVTMAGVAVAAEHPMAGLFAGPLTARGLPDPAVVAEGLGAGYRQPVAGCVPAPGCPSGLLGPTPWGMEAKEWAGALAVDGPFREDPEPEAETMGHCIAAPMVDRTGGEGDAMARWLESGCGAARLHVPLRREGETAEETTALAAGAAASVGAR